MDELEQLNLFLKEYALYLALAGVLAIVLTILIMVLSGQKKKKINEDFEGLFSVLGGRENLVSAEARGSRVTLHLADEHKIRVDLLPKEIVSNYIKMTGKIVLVVGSNSERIAQIVNKKTA